MIPFVEDLKEANDFLNLLLDNIGVAVLIADENMRVYRFNDSFLRLFEEPGEKVAGERLGRAMGCIHTIDENKPCGETSYCEQCRIRLSMIETMMKKTPVKKLRLEKAFYIDGKVQNKILELTTRFISYNRRNMVLVIFYDITEIEQQRIALQRKQNELDKDLEAAAGIQRHLLPDAAPRLVDIRLAWKFRPCSRIGGDIFNIQQIDRRHTGLYILDVCGHGVSAAFFAVAVSQFLHSRSCFLVDQEGIVSPGMVLNSLNEAFPFERFDSYFSIVYMVVDHARLRVAYSCAGHPPPVWIHADGAQETLDLRGPIGLSKDTKYAEEERVLSPGDKIILYTDGVFENRNSHEEFLGKERFYRILQENFEKPIAEFIESTFQQVEKFGGASSPDDDVSILGLEYRP